MSVVAWQWDLQHFAAPHPTPLMSPSPFRGPRYHLLAHTTLTLAAVQDGFRTHDLTLASHGMHMSVCWGHWPCWEGLWASPLLTPHPHPVRPPPPEENPAWLPLYGSVCCRLAAQPLCMTQPTASGTLRVQVRGPKGVEGDMEETKLDYLRVGCGSGGTKWFGKTVG